MYEPFEQAIDMYVEHPEHKKPFADFVAFLERCDRCGARSEFVCRICRCARGKPCIRMAELPHVRCPLEK